MSAPLVLDTNIVLDAFVFRDPAALALREQIEAGRRWLATAAMRGELVRVLAYPQIDARLAAESVEAAHVIGRFDGLATCVEAAPKAPFTCKDPDDQKFVDLAVAHAAVLLSKDRAVTSMARRLARAGVVTASWLPA